MACASIAPDDNFDLDIGDVAKHNRVADTRLRTYLTKITKEHELKIDKIDKSMLETRREINLFKIAEDKIHAKKMKNHLQVRNMTKHNNHFDCHVGKNVTDSKIIQADSEKGPLPTSNTGSTSNLTVTFDPVQKKQNPLQLFRSNTVDDAIEVLSPLSRELNSRNSSKSHGGLRKSTSSRELKIYQHSKRILSRKEEQNEELKREQSSVMTRMAGQDTTDITMLWKNHRCLARGHLPSKPLSLGDIRGTRIGVMPLKNSISSSSNLRPDNRPINLLYSKFSFTRETTRILPRIWLTPPS